MNPTLRWESLPAIPDPEGFAGAFAGVSGGALIVAGGANLTGDRWKDPIAKKWYDSAFVLERPDGAWKGGFKLPRACAYGVSVSVDDAAVCIGGGDAERNFTEVYALRWRNGALENSPLPALPKPCANLCGAVVGRTIYVAGGIETPTAVAAMKTFWALDLSETKPQWRELDPWPGPARMLAVAGVGDGSFFLFSGTGLHADAAGKPARDVLRDAYRYTPGQGWRRLADLPRAAVAAPSPALGLDPAHLLIVSGDDGTHMTFQPVKEHPGFPRDALAYDLRADTWTTLGEIPISRATVPTVEWQGRFVIPNGEARPRVRTPEVWAASHP